MKNNNPPALGQKENAKHGEVFFPVQKYITRLAADYPVITTHWHDEAELTLITKAHAPIRLICSNMKQRKAISSLSRHCCCIPFQ